MNCIRTGFQSCKLNRNTKVTVTSLEHALNYYFENTREVKTNDELKEVLLELEETGAVNFGKDEMNDEKCYPISLLDVKIRC